MNINYQAHFRTASAIEESALAAGLTPERARIVSEKLAASPLPRAQRRRILDRIGMSDATAAKLLTIIKEKNA